MSSPHLYSFIMPPDDAPLFKALRKDHPELSPEEIIAKLVSRALRECVI
jgi:hypothetical protein